MSTKLPWEVNTGGVSRPYRNICSYTSVPKVMKAEMGRIILDPNGLLCPSFGYLGGAEATLSPTLHDSIFGFIIPEGMKSG
ncbi:hypothetical protein TNCV_193061 [Trichonephila clavipes]|nr:hypothetical protein TNCV_193061 [Trichonephila clavipes]